MTAIVSRGDAANLPFPDESIDTVITSPPYFGLRSYTDGGVHYEGQVGAEATPAEYLDALIACTREWARCLKPGGSIFVNLGDKYSGSFGTPPQAGFIKDGSNKKYSRSRRADRVDHGAPVKSLIGLPWRYAIRCIDELGLILRAEIVWAKPNGLPESVTDRVRRSHEQVFHFVKQPRYYSAVDEVREPHSAHTLRYYSDGSAAVSGRREDRQRGHGRDPETRGANFATTTNPLGKLPGSVWTIPTAPLRVPEELGIDHFAAYPPELVRRIVLGWSPREVCTACGEGRRPVLHRVTTGQDNNHRAKALGRIVAGNAGMGGSAFRKMKEAGGGDRITGYVCACPDTTAPATPGVVLDPFGGTGTTALVASVHGRVGISVDLSADYCRLAQWRTTDEKQRAKAAGTKPKAPKKAAPVADVIELPAGQIDLFGEEWTA